MSDKETYTYQQVIAAVKAAKGKVSIAAAQLGCDRRTIYNYAKRYATVKEAIRDARKDFDEQLLDIAEMKLREDALAGKWWAVKYILDTKGSQKRGYAQLKKTEADVTSNGQTISVTFNPVPAREEPPS